MTLYLLANDVNLLATTLGAGKIIDSNLYDVALLRSAGAVLLDYTEDNAARAALLRSHHLNRGSGPNFASDGFVFSAPGPATTTTASFVQPAGGDAVTVAVASSAFWSPDQAVFVAGAGDYWVASIPDGAHLSLRNLDVPGSVAPGSAVASGARVTCSGYPGAGTEIRVATTDATPTALDFDLAWIPPLTTFRFDVVVVARSAADDAAFTLSGLFRKDAGGVITQTGAAQLPAGLIYSAGAAAWTGSLSLPSLGHVAALVVGAAATAIGWAGLGQAIRRTGVT